MTQRQRVLWMLKAAGAKGVRSDAFLEARIPRAAARILELKAEGLEISSEREKQYVRYRLETSELTAGVPAPGQEIVRGASGELSGRPVPSCFDADIEWTA